MRKMANAGLFRRALASAMCAALIASGSPAAAFAAESNDMTWEIVDGNVLVISGTGSLGAYDPANGYYAPWYQKSHTIKKLVIEDGVTGIGDYAFYGLHNLASVEIDEDVTTIGKGAFSDCYSLNSVGYGDNKACTAVLHGNVDYVGEDAFYGCSQLRNVYLEAADLCEYHFDNAGNVAAGRYDFCNPGGTTLHVSQNYNGTVAEGDCEALYQWKNACGNAVKADIVTEAIETTDAQIEEVAAEQAANEQKAAAEKAAAEEQAKKAAAEQKAAEEKKAAEEQAKKAAEEKAAAEKRAAEEKAAEKAAAEKHDAEVKDGADAARNSAANQAKKDRKNQDAAAKKAAHSKDTSAKKNNAVEGKRGAEYSATEAKNASEDARNAAPAQGQKDHEKRVETAKKTSDSKNAASKKSAADEAKRSLTYPHKVEGDNTTWKIENESVLVIGGTGEMKSYVSFGGYTEAPWTQYGNQIKKVVIENGVTGIGDYAFSDLPALKSVEMPAGVTTIGDGAFYLSTKLNNIGYGNNKPGTAVFNKYVRHIGSGAFHNCPEIVDVVLERTDLSDYQLSGVYDGKFGFAGPGATTLHVSRKCAENCELVDQWRNAGSVIREDLESELRPEIDATSKKNAEQEREAHKKAQPSKDASAQKEAEAAARHGEHVHADEVAKAADDARAAATAQAKKDGEETVQKQKTADAAKGATTQTQSQKEAVRGADAKAAEERAGEIADNAAANRDAAAAQAAGEGKKDAAKANTVKNQEKAEAKRGADAKAAEEKHEAEVKAGADAARKSAAKQGAQMGKESEARRKAIAERKDASTKKEREAAKKLGSESPNPVKGDNTTWRIVDGSILVIGGTGDMKSYARQSYGQQRPWELLGNKITKVVFEKGVTGIGAEAFDYLTTLKSVELTDDITSIGANAFRGCTDLQSVDYGSNRENFACFGANVKTIGKNAFAGCDKITEVYFEADDLSSYCFEGDGAAEINGFNFAKPAATTLHVVNLYDHGFAGTKCTALYQWELAGADIKADLMTADQKSKLADLTKVITMKVAKRTGASKAASAQKAAKTAAELGAQVAAEIEAARKHAFDQAKGESGSAARKDASVKKTLAAEEARGMSFMTSEANELEKALHLKAHVAPSKYRTKTTERSLLEQIRRANQFNW